MATRWLYDDPGTGYHDGRCPCEGHCGNCFEDLASIRAQIRKMIATGAVGPNGPYTEASQLSERARYCSPYCNGRAKRDRALTRRLTAGKLLER